jgi:hypothetical protein
LSRGAQLPVLVMAPPLLLVPPSLLLLLLLVLLLVLVMVPSPLSQRLLPLLRVRMRAEVCIAP